MSKPIITLTTDFGMQGPYVGAMKGVILAINPEATIVDISHEVGPQAVREAAFCLAAAAGYYPPGTAHVVVVDPGVGTERRVICIEADGQYLIGPDNGVLSWAVRGASRVWAYELTERRYWRKQVSATFHGRDIMAPAAAHISLGVKPEQLGRPIEDWVRLPWPNVRRAGAAVYGEVLVVDRFGNLITNIARGDLAGFDLSKVTVRCGDCRVGSIRRTYGEVPEGELLALFGSTDLLELAVRNGSAADKLAAGPGAPVWVERKNQVN